MSIFLTENDRVIVQGMTGSEGRKHTRRMLCAGTKVVAGVNPRKAGTSVAFDVEPIGPASGEVTAGTVEVPVYGTVAEARAIVARLRTDLPRWAAVAATGIRNPTATGTTRRNAAEATPEWVLTHMLRELTQHTGHMEICRDVVARRAD